MAIDWTAVQGVAAVLALLINAVVAFSLLVSIRSLRQTEATKETAIYIWALERIREIRPIMNNIRDQNGDGIWVSQNRDQVMRVLEVLQMICFMAEEGVIKKQRIVDMWGKSFVEQWVYLNRFVKEFRVRIGEPEEVADGAFFARSFERFALFARSDLERRFVMKLPTIEEAAV